MQGSNITKWIPMGTVTWSVFLFLYYFKVYMKRSCAHVPTMGKKNQEWMAMEKVHACSLQFCEIAAERVSISPLLQQKRQQAAAKGES